MLTIRLRSARHVESASPSRTDTRKEPLRKAGHKRDAAHLIDNEQHWRFEATGLGRVRPLHSYFLRYAIRWQVSVLRTTRQLRSHRDMKDALNKEQNS